MKLFCLLMLQFLIIGTSITAQSTNINTFSNSDDYAVLRDMIDQTVNEHGSQISYEYKVHPNKVGHIEYFIDGNSFFAKSNFDIYNRIIYADFDRDGTILPYKFDKGRIDSLYVRHESELFPLETYLYNIKLDYYAKVLGKGKFILAEALSFKMQKGNINPVLDANSFQDKVILKKIPYLIDLGHWYKIPKQKGELQDFIKLHYRKATNKKAFKGAKSLEILMKYN